MTEGPESRSTVPVRLAAVLLAVLGVFPLAAVIKWAPVVAWLPRAGLEWVISIALTLALCYALARYAAATVDGLLAGARSAVMSLTPRDFALAVGLFTFLASLFVCWFC